MVKSKFYTDYSNYVNLMNLFLLIKENFFLNYYTLKDVHVSCFLYTNESWNTKDVSL
jgi:hypothetical protein